MSTWRGEELAPSGLLNCMIAVGPSDGKISGRAVTAAASPTIIIAAKHHAAARIALRTPSNLGRIGLRDGLERKRLDRSAGHFAHSSRVTIEVVAVAQQIGGRLIDGRREVIIVVAIGLHRAVRNLAAKLGVVLIAWQKRPTSACRCSLEPFWNRYLIETYSSLVSF